MTDIFSYVNNFSKYQNSQSICLQKAKLDKKPIISILIPTFNDNKYFEQALESALTQNFIYPYEIIVVDNTPISKGINNTQIIIQKTKSNKISYYRNEENIGMIGNWNRCIELANADYITYCHSDDKLLPDCLTHLYSNTNQLGNKCITCAYDIINANNNIVRKSRYEKKLFGIIKLKHIHTYSRFDIFMSSPGFGCGCLFSKGCLIALGGFSEEYYPSSDYALFIKYLFKYGMLYSEKPTFLYRKAENSSYKNYNKFSDMDLFFRKCMIEKMHYPKLLLKTIMLSNFKISKNIFAKEWDEGRKNKYAYSILDKFIISLTKLRHLKRLNFSIFKFKTQDSI